MNAANRDGETPLIRAATQYEAECAGILIDAGANVNASTKAGTHSADGRDRRTEGLRQHQPRGLLAGIAKLLIARGADVKARDAEGRTALSLAEKRGHRDIIPLLAP